MGRVKSFLAALAFTGTFLLLVAASSPPASVGVGLIQGLASGVSAFLTSGNIPTQTASIQSSASAANLAPQFDTSSAASVTIATGSNASLTALTASRSYLLIINDSNIEGDTGLYLTSADGTGTAVLISSVKGVFVAPTTSPSAGKMSLGYSSGWHIYNAEGNQINFKIMALRVS